VRTKQLLQWLSKRSGAVIAVSLFGCIALIIGLVFLGRSYDTNQIIVAIAAIAAAFAGASAFANLLQAVEVQKEREAQERPFIVAYFEGASSGSINFVIQNLGNSPALNVKLKITPAPVNFKGKPLDQVSLFANPISFLPPTAAIRQILDMGYRFLADGKPTKFQVSVTYQSIHGETFNETIDHDLDYLIEATLPAKTAEDHLKVISEHLEKIVRTLDKVEGFNSLLVETPEQYQSRISREIRKAKSQKDKHRTN
jgi:hypothetical protein